MRDAVSGQDREVGLAAEGAMELGEPRRDVAITLAADVLRLDWPAPFGQASSSQRSPTSLSARPKIRPCARYRSRAGR